MNVATRQPFDGRVTLESLRASVTANIPIESQLRMPHQVLSRSVAANLMAAKMGNQPYVAATAATTTVPVVTTPVAVQEVNLSAGSNLRALLKGEQPELTVMVCTLPSRVSNFLPRVITQLDQQCMGKPVQLLYLGDNRSMTIGKKRNLMMSLAEGKYVCFVDDDDELAPDYIDCLLKGIQTGVDCVLFDVPVTLNGSAPKNTKFSIQHTNRDHADFYERKPAHVHPIKACYAKQVPFPDLHRGEDYSWQAKVVPMLKTEHQVGKSLYFYNWSIVTSETTGRND